jgi:UDP-N-acetylglucosamine diphosphorylase/glucosamine-1-phosphate N-acetyltransferase
VLAGGMGKRFNSNSPKVCHKINGVSMINHIINKLNVINISNIGIVTGVYHNEIYNDVMFENNNTKINWINQFDARGTGHAVLCSIDYLKNTSANYTLIMSGDAPLIESSTLENMIKFSVDNNTDCTVLTSHVENPFGYGRIIKHDNNHISKIIEQKDGNDDELKINLVNGGMYIFRTKYLIQYITELNCNNAQGEYYLTDMIKIFNNNNLKVLSFEALNEIEIANINSMTDYDNVIKNLK